jgi:hypothetical protein
MQAKELKLEKVSQTGGEMNSLSNLDDMEATRTNAVGGTECEKLFGR